VNPLDVPPLVTEYLAKQLGIDDPSCAARYAERPNTPREHREEIKARTSRHVSAPAQPRSMTPSQIDLTSYLRACRNLDGD
jgi:Domain of unknown function (DUF4158)